MKEKTVTLLLAAGILWLGGTFICRAEEGQTVAAMGTGKELPIVVIDAGHGGKDPGKVGTNEALEKDINLAIAMRLKSLLEQNEIAVIMTREEDRDLASEQAVNRKNEDLHARVAVAQNAAPVVMVSIHQNSYPDEDVDGAQVFYYTGSKEGKVFGNIVQESLKREIRDGNHRVAKANKEYYLLKKSPCPAVIVECGFLSNPEEAILLASEEYQEKLAFAIHLGIMEYINTLDCN